MKDIQSLLGTSDPPDLGPKGRSGTKSVAEIDRVLGANADPLVRATVLLWHDHLDEAHQIVQNIETPDGSYLHGIMHRREPDYSNAKYWFHRVGSHRCFEEIADAASTVLDRAFHKRDKAAPPIIAKGKWDPFAFIDACQATSGARADRDMVEAMRQIQAAELSTLLKHFLKT